MYQMYNPQANIERINSQIAELEKIRSQIQQPIPQPTNLTQNFQLAPSRDGIKYANSIDDVRKENVVNDTPFFSKDMSIVWLKNAKGEIKAYELTEIIPKDEKDIQIELLQAQLNELKKEMRRYDEYTTNAIKSKDTTNTDWDDETNGKPIEENKPTSIQRIPRSKK